MLSNKSKLGPKGASFRRARIKITLVYKEESVSALSSRDILVGAPLSASALRERPRLCERLASGRRQEPSISGYFGIFGPGGSRIGTQPSA